MKRKTIIILTSILVILGLSAWGVRNYLFAPYSGGDIRINIPVDATDSDVRDILTLQAGSYGGRVYNLWQKQGGSAPSAHGSYIFSDGLPALKASRMLLRGRQTPVRLTFNNMRTVEALAGRIGRIMECDSAAFLAATDCILSSHGLAKTEYASAYIPDTYFFYWTESPADIVGKLYSERRDFWNEERTAKAAALGLTPAQIHTIASIVEEESNKTDEWGKIARLYINRVQRGMPLQADPTVKFALGDFSLRRISGKDLKVNSPYNTYTILGLPPGPIRIAERAALDSVLNAPEHNYLYMCARSDFSGYHDFATSYDRHRINAARYHRALDRRGL